MIRTHAFLALSAILVLIALVPGVFGITVPLGDPVPLSGAAPVADTVYLFLTGPNLPSNGVRLDDITAEVVTGVPSTFTQAPVSNGQWQYTWYTGSTGGTLDAGSYTVYVSTTPVGRNDLSRAVYSSISITLTLPTIEVPPTGTLVVESVPAGAGVVVDGVLQGTSPVELTGVPEGQHLVVLSFTGYANSTSTVTVVAGETTSVNVALVPVSLQPTPTVSASPETSPPTSAAATSPTPAPLSLAAIAGALGGALALMVFREGTHRDDP
ncbi:hypothetical protein J2741_002062 [Methanolinea mesophila]|uniref:PEGA domain-containing protein n=1 Tax=Methanolinea mesophila TaxID=547055 RepID=UPI001AEB856E|nr:PEGA domain-containing protein [Methanolinea mesophila]MBP1929515.1 hypothetical protein [Methanolinea mesophila]